MSAAKTPALVLYDLDGTLLDSELAKSRIDTQALRDVGIEISLEQVHYALAGYGLSDKYRLACEMVRCIPDHAQFESFKEERNRAMATVYDRPDILAHDGAKITLQCLRAKGYGLAVVTNNTQTQAQYAIKHFGLSHYFNGHVYSSDRVSRPKPGPDMLELAMRDYGVSPDRAVMVGDTVSDVLAAQAAGVACLGYTAGRHESVLPDAFRNGASILLPSHKQILLHIDRLLPL